MAHAYNFLEMVEEARPRVKEIDVHTLNTLVNDNQPVTIIDVREDEEWAQGYIPRALHLGKGVIERDIAKHVSDNDAPLVLIVVAVIARFLLILFRKWAILM